MLAEWSVMTRYLSPRSSAARAISSFVFLPSEATVWECSSPLTSFSSTSFGSSPLAAASSSPRFSRSSGSM